MSETSPSAEEVQRLVRHFQPFCNDRETLVELDLVAGEPERWREAHGLFRRIRSKTLVSEKSGDKLREIQYLFEEVCAKTLFNLSGSSTPFDEDSPCWVRPNADALAAALGIESPVPWAKLGP
jgi:hypothetical protein